MWVCLYYCQKLCNYCNIHSLSQKGIIPDLLSHYMNTILVVLCYVQEVVLVFMVNGQIGRLRTVVRKECKVVFVPKFCLQNIKPERMLQFFVMCMGEIIKCTAIGCRPK
jgi:hypothetical protein